VQVSTGYDLSAQYAERTEEQMRAFQMEKRSREEMKFIKPWKGGYMMVLGSGRVMQFSEEQLKIMSMAYDEIRFVSEKSRKSFSLNSEPMDKLMAGIKERRKNRGDYE